MSNKKDFIKLGEILEVPTQEPKTANVPPAVTYVKLDSAVFVPGILQVETGKSINPDTHPGIEMWLGAFGVNCTYKGKSFIIPFHKCGCIVYAS
jgi:hypothetical protein